MNLLPGLVALPVLLATFYVDTKDFKLAENILKNVNNSSTSVKLKLTEILIHQVRGNR